MKKIILFFLLILPFHLFAEEYNPTTLVFPPFEHCLGLRKVTGFHAAIYLGKRTYFHNPQGLAAVKLSEWDEPNERSDDAELTVYGVNRGQHEIIYNTSPLSVDIFGEKGSEDGQFYFPTGIAATIHGDVYVADTGNHRIVRLKNRDTQLRFVANIGEKGTDEGEFWYPNDVAVDSRNRIYIADSKNNRVQVMDSSGVFLHSFGDSLLKNPTSIAVIDEDDRWNISRNSAIYIVDADRNRLSSFELNGAFIDSTTISALSQEEGMFNFLAIDYRSQVYATDKINHCIHKFDKDLKYITSFGREGDDDKEFQSPRGIAIWKRFGQIFVAEEGGAQYYFIGTDILDLRTEETERSVLISFFMTETARVSIHVYQQKKLIDTIYENARLHARKYIAHWRKTDGKGNPVEPGKYKIVITATPTYSSSRFFRRTNEIEVEIR